MNKAERNRRFEAYKEHKKRIGQWTDEKPKKETKLERLERLKRNLEKSKLRQLKAKLKQNTEN